MAYFFLGFDNNKMVAQFFFDIKNFINLSVYIDVSQLKSSYESKQGALSILVSFNNCLKE